MIRRLFVVWWLTLALSLDLVGCGSEADHGSVSTGDPSTAVDAGSDAGAVVVDLEKSGKGVQAALDKWLKEVEAVGAVAVIKTEDGQRWQGATGLADKLTMTKSDPSYYYRLASVTKHIMATTFMSLVEDGALSLEDPLSKYREYPNGEHITLRMLLNHTSGVRDYQSSDRFVADAKKDLSKRWTPDEIIQYAIDDGPEFPPGQGWHYSNTGYLLLGQVLEKLTGKTAAEVLHERVFAKANMKQAFLTPTQALPKGAHLATGYSEVIMGLVLDFSQVPTDTIETLGWTAGGVVTTADEVANFGLAMIRNGVISQESRDEMAKVMRHPHTEDGADYGLGTKVIEHRHMLTLGHAGGMPGFRTRLMYVPDLGLSIAVLTNSEHGEMDDLALRLLDAALD